MIPTTAVFVAVSVLAAPAWAGEDLIDSLDEFVAACEARRSAHSQFSVQGVSIRGVAGADEAAMLQELCSGASWPRDGADELIEAVLGILDDREQFDCSMWVSDQVVVLERVRGPMDASLAQLQATSPPGAVVQPGDQRELIHVWPDGELRIQDRYVVSRSRRHSRDGLVAPLDMTLADWTPILDDERHPAGQARFMAPDADNPSACVVTFVGPASSARGEPRTQYVFDASDGFRPVSVRSGYPGEELRRIDYLCDSAEANGLPVAVFDLTRTSAEAPWSVEVSILTSVSTGDAATPPSPRIPAIRLELSELPDGSGLLIDRVLPPWLEGVAPEERLATAVGVLLNNWGSTEESYDLDGDGVVGASDLERACTEL